MHYMEGMRLITVLELVAPTPNENTIVTDTEFNNVPVRLYLPRGAPDGLRRAMVYFHGGGWCLGDAGKLCCIAATALWERSQQSCQVQPFVLWELPQGGAGDWCITS